MLRLWRFPQLGKLRMTTDLNDKEVLQVWREEGDPIVGGIRWRAHIKSFWDPVERGDLGEAEEWVEE